MSADLSAAASAVEAASAVLDQAIRHLAPAGAKALDENQAVAYDLAHAASAVESARTMLDYGAKVTGVTVHFVDNEYDRGPIIWQQPVPVFDDDTPDTLADRVFEVEKEAYPHVLRLLAAGRLTLEGRRVKIAASKRRHTESPSDQ